jgi:hypothetical protein
MKKTKKSLGITALILLSLTPILTYADADEDYITQHNAVNRSFIDSLTRNRSYVGDKSVRHIEIDGNEEFLEAMENGTLEEKLEEGNKLQKKYITTEIKNVDLDEDDLKDIAGDTLNLGAETEEGNLVQSLTIEDSSIQTDKHINAGVSSASDDISDITSVIDIDNSQLSGRAEENKHQISTDKYFD